MSRGVDVLGVLERASQYANNNCVYEDARELEDADAAVSDAIRLIDDITALTMARRIGGPIPMDLQELDRALGMAIDLANRALARVRGSA